MQPISRRTALLLGAAGLTGTAAAAVGLSGLWRGGIQVETGATLREPEVLRSRSGSLRVTLEAARIRHRVAGIDAETLGYNRGLPGPTLVLRPGDRLQMRLVNRLDDLTNLHVHGLHVSPEANGDNVFVEVAPGELFDYDYRLPDDHPPGVFWYHPHHHGLVADQVYGGLVVSDISLAASGRVLPPTEMERMLGRQGEIVLVNGQVTPRLEARTGDRERWRVVNACSSRFLSLRLDGHRLHLLGMDGGRYAAPAQTEQLLLAPGNRADLLVEVGRQDGVLRALPYDRGGMGMRGMRGPRSVEEGPARLADLRVTGDRGEGGGVLPAFPPPRDLREAPVARRRQLVLAMGMGMGGMGGMSMGGMGGMPGGMGSMMSFTIDGLEFDAGRVDQEVRRGTVEEWTILNTSPMDHPFHLHVWPMQVIEENGREHELPTWRDVVVVPARGGVRVRVAFDDFGGRTVYHCHVLDHEDRGMMGVVEAS